ncbi:MAG: protein translocase subunit SecF [Sandaracinus sp.]|nr:protein translocase subunit SecF [Sandaracinus sp.]|tara:strand:- start:1289 stop:2461 length:1173 start_codon:yes stop_codon:yes gene_type:complete
MEIVNPNVTIDFMRHRKPVVLLSLALVVASIVSLFFPGPNYGIDFAGGTEVQLRFGGDITSAKVRETLQSIGHDGADVVAVEDSPNEYIIRVREVSSLSEEKIASIEANLTRTLGEDLVREVRVSPGGDKVTLRLAQDVEHQQIVDVLEGEGARVRGEITSLPGTDDVRLEVQLRGVADELVAGLQEELGELGPEAPLRAEWVGPKAGEQLRDAAIQSLLYAIAFIMVYVAFRFDLRFAPGGVLAMFHDVVITLGIYVLVQKEVNLTTVAALLTVLGYSINDTIVVYDRIRENMSRYRDASLREIINRSTSQMLSRTIVTSGTTLLSVVAFFIWGTPVIRDISFALFCGILIGTYSSIYIAAPVTEWMDNKFFSEEAQKRRAAKRRAASA